MTTRPEFSIRKSLLPRLNSTMRLRNQPLYFGIITQQGLKHILHNPPL